MYHYVTTFFKNIYGRTNNSSENRNKQKVVGYSANFVKCVQEHCNFIDQQNRPQLFTRNSWGRFNYYKTTFYSQDRFSSRLFQITLHTSTVPLFPVFRTMESCVCFFLLKLILVVKSVDSYSMTKITNESMSELLPCQAITDIM